MDDVRSASAADATSRAAVALTFDMEHPSRAEHDPQSPRHILDTLAEQGVRATFFVQGRWARAEPDLARRVVEDDHLLGCHSHFHAPLTALSDDGILTDSTSAVAALSEVTGSDPRPWYRCPFGAGHDDARVLTALDRGGFTNVHWNIDPQDWVEECSPQQIIRSVLDGVARIGDGSIVLLHSWPTATAAALPQLLQSLSKTYRLVGVDDPAFAITGKERHRWPQSVSKE